MSTFSKSLHSLLALQSIATSSVVVGSAVDVSTTMGGLCFIHFGRRAATAAGAGANIRLEASHSLTLDSSWYPFGIFTTAFGATSSDPITTTSNAGQKVITMTTTTGMVVGDLIFIDDATIANAEWARVKVVTGSTSLTIEDNLVNTHVNTTPVLRLAEIYQPVPIPDGALRIRCVADGSLFTQAWAMEAFYSTIDGIG